MKRVKIAELKDHLSSHLRAVERGTTIEVTDRERPIARIVPATGAKASLTWRRATLPFSTVRDQNYPPAKLPFDIVELLLEDRRKQ
jgi:prevent-host-death family protein